MTAGTKLLILTGLSGSGKSIALHTLEDLGYYCIDNLPVCLFEAFSKHLIEAPEEAFQSSAVGIDARSQPDKLGRLPKMVDKMREQGINCEMIFLEAQSDTLIKRFSETRRKHPLSTADISLDEAIKRERVLLEPLISNADLCIDTTHTNLHELRDLIRGRVSGDKQQVSLLVESFGFKHGVPRDIDFVFDVRCLPNPHWQAELRPFTGLDGPVAQFLENSEDTRQMRDDLIRFLEEWIPRFEADGRSYLTIAIGCTGGQHRSVFITDQLFRHFKSQGHKILSRHRELS
ncbi:MAG: RNase adapter RapZ [endosymbiont of Seepiophila jonesi]|uniref:RNase adapter RapZ n=1 Tax=endosymbiont of Lamellibrachia luymesi TaxID=2200907 RepID=A0A370DVX3_9GAMM|nr:MAG: RNase adapter RapZ [endosymbiont of Lamellibrachia luymesi]RDH91893.1 MAG: RNase adapter RapZ [endosymbiont of Seepiophila jonesi]